MSSYGDNYSYQIAVTSNTSGASAATAALGSFATTTAQATAATKAQTAATQAYVAAQVQAVGAAQQAVQANQQVAASAQQAAVATAAAATAAAVAAGGGGGGIGGGGRRGGRGRGGGGGGGSGWGGLANVLSGIGVLYDDLQYGSRNVANNLMALGMAAPHPALKILLTVAGGVTAVFHEQIDEALGLGQAYEKLGEKAKESSDSFEKFADVAKRLPPELQAGTVAAKELYGTLDQIIGRIGGTDAHGLIVKALVGERGYLKREIADATAEAIRLNEQAEKFKALDRQYGATNESAIRLADTLAKAAEAQKKAQELTARQAEMANQTFETMVAMAGTSDEALQQLGDRMRLLGEQTKNADLEKLGIDLIKQTEAYKKVLADLAVNSAKRRDQIKEDKEFEKSVGEDLLKIKESVAQREKEIEREREEADRKHTEEMKKQAAEYEWIAQQELKRAAAAEEAAKRIADAKAAEAKAVEQAKLSDDTKRILDVMGDQVGGMAGQLLQGQTARGMSLEDAMPIVREMIERRMMQLGAKGGRANMEAAQEIVKQQAGFLQAQQMQGAMNDRLFFENADPMAQLAMQAEARRRAARNANGGGDRPAWRGQNIMGLVGGGKEITAVGEEAKGMGDDVVTMAEKTVDAIGTVGQVLERQQAQMADQRTAISSLAGRLEDQRLFINKLIKFGPPLQNPRNNRAGWW